MARDGQQRVEVRPGVFLWLNEADRKAHEARQAQAGAPEVRPITSASITAPEKAVVATPKPSARRK